MSQATEIAKLPSTIQWGDIVNVEFGYGCTIEKAKVIKVSFSGFASEGNIPANYHTSYDLEFTPKLYPGDIVPEKPHKYRLYNVLPDFIRPVN